MTAYDPPYRAIVIDLDCDVKDWPTGVTGPYTFTVRAVNQFGSSAPSDPSPVYVSRPSPPEWVAADPGNASATVRWTTSFPNQPGVTEYRAHHADGTLGCTAAAPGSSCVVPNLTNNQQYTFTVRSVNAAGESDNSDPVSVTPYPGPTPPAQASAVVANDGVQVTWTEATSTRSAVTGYRVRAVGTDRGCTTGATERTCLVTGLTSGAEHTFTVEARNAAGWGEPATTAPLTWTYVPHAEGHLSVIASPSTTAWANAQANATYEARLENLGPDTMTAATLHLTLPDSATLVSTTGPFDCAGTTCTLQDPLATRQSATLLVNLRLTAAGGYPLEVSATVAPSPRLCPPATP